MSAHKSFKLVVPLHIHELREDGQMDFEKPLLIKVKNVDLPTVIKIIRSLDEPSSFDSIYIRKRGRDRS